MAHTSTNPDLFSRLLRVFLTISVALLVVAPVGAASLTVAWDRSQDSHVVGYVVEWGERSAVYTTQVFVGDVTSYTISELDEGRRYHVVVRARTASGATSAPSNEAAGVASDTSGAVSPPAPSPDSPTGSPPVGSPSSPPDGTGELPQVPLPPATSERVRLASLDFDEDAIDDVAVYRHLKSVWYVRGSTGLELYLSDLENQGPDVVPVAADYDGDGLADLVSWQPSSGQWVFYNSSDGFLLSGKSHLGATDSLPVPADYDGDGAVEIAVFDPAGYWRFAGGESLQFGRSGDIPVPFDLDANGLAELAVFRPENGVWYSTGDVGDVRFGRSGDVPVPADYDGDGRVDIAVYRPSTSTWFVRNQFQVSFGQAGDLPVPLDTDGDGRDEVIVHRPSDGTWLRLDPATGATDVLMLGEPGDLPAGAAPFLLVPFLD